MKLSDLVSAYRALAQDERKRTRQRQGDRVNEARQRQRWRKRWDLRQQLAKRGHGELASLLLAEERCQVQIADLIRMHSGGVEMTRAKDQLAEYQRRIYLLLREHS